jgi:replicative DNA helicase
MSQQNLGDTRVMPNSPNAEKSVLGAMMISPEAVASAMESLTSQDFYFDIHKRIFEAMAALARSAQPVDFVTLTDQLEKDGNLEALGGYEYITELNRFVPTAAHVDEYVRIVLGRSLLRRLIGACAKITEDAFSGQEVQDVLYSAERAIFVISQNKQKQNFVSIQEAVDKTLEKVETLMSNPDALAGLRTGYSSLDNWLGGLRSNELILLAARPSMGKSALALNIAQQVPRNNPNATVAIFALEMPYEDLTARMLSSIGSLPLQNLRTGRLQGHDMERLTNAAFILSDTSIFIDDTSSITVMEMRSKCRRLKMEKGLSLVIIDYLQLISGAGGNSKNAESHQQEVAEMTRAPSTPPTCGLCSRLWPNAGGPLQESTTTLRGRCATTGRILPEAGIPTETTRTELPWRNGNHTPPTTGRSCSSETSRSCKPWSRARSSASCSRAARAGASPSGRSTASTPKRNSAEIRMSAEIFKIAFTRG